MRRHNTTIIALMATLALAATACGRQQREENSQQREQAWRQSLADSVKMADDSIAALNSRIEQCHRTTDSLLPLYREFNNPRYVEGFYIHKDFGNAYPLKSTGIVARMTKGEALELVAVLQGGNFEQLRLSADGMSVESPVVPNDQQLNYRQNGLTTVAFTGAGALSLGEFVAAHRNSNIKVEYLQGKTVASRLLSDKDKQIIADTYLLADSHRLANRLARRVTLFQHKKMLFQSRLDRQPQESGTGNAKTTNE